MTLSEIREWFFELVGILLPGGLLLLVIAAFSVDPAAFHTFHVDPPKLRELLRPFDDPLLDAVVMSGVAFVAGHLVQQMSVYLMKAYSRFGHRARLDLISTVFSDEETIQYLLPDSPPRRQYAGALKPVDYFMMIYPEEAPGTKRDTFIAVAGFSGAAALIALLIALLTVVSFVVARQSGLPTHVVRAISGSATTTLVAFIFIQRCSYFHDMADRMVVTRFLRRLGLANRNPSSEPQARLRRHDRRD